MALQISTDVMGITAAEAYVRPEVYFRSGPKADDGATPYNSVVKVYATKAQSEPGGKGAFRDFNCLFSKSTSETIEAACYAALKSLPEFAGAADV